MSLLSEFKDFALKGNVMDMAVGVIIGAAFGNIVTALTDNFINPLIAVIFGGNSEDGLQIGGQFAIRGVAFNALVLFIILKAINTASAKAAALAAAKLKKEKEEEAEKPAEPSEEVKLLTEIKDILASKS